MRFQEPFRLRRNLSEIGETLGLPPVVSPTPAPGEIGALYLSSNRYEDAIAEFRCALDGANDLHEAEREDLREKLAWCLYWTGDLDEAWRLAGVVRSSDGARPGALLLEGRISLERGETAVARERGERTLALAVGVEAPEWIGRAHSLLGIVSQREGHSGEAREHFEEALLAYRITGDDEGECRSYVHLGTLAKSECRWEEAVRYLERARRKADREGFFYIYGSASLNGGNLSYRLGFLEEARGEIGEALRVFREIGYALGTVRALVAQARLELDLGHDEEFRASIGLASEMCGGGRFPRERVLVSLLEGAAAERRGFLEEAEEKYGTALRLARALAAGGDLALEATLALAALFVLSERGEEAHRLAMEIEEGVADAGDLSLEGRRKRVLAEAALAAGAFSEAEEAIDMAIRIFERIAYRRDLARSLSVAGRIEAAREEGSMEKAFFRFLGAKQHYGELGDEREAALVSVELARRWIDVGSPALARQNLSEALDVFDRLGEACLAAEAEALLARVAPEPDGAHTAFDRIVTRDAAMRETLRVARRVSRYPVTVLIEGETGTGKQLVARAIHDASARAGRHFVTVNCASLPEQILESELFGYVKGAFTGATADRKGLFEEADGGTILLDEIGKAGPHVQRSLLHVLDRSEIRSLGETRHRPVDVRVLCATSNLTLRKDIEEDRFLKDLYYRINDITLRLPPLRERKADVEPLTRHFLDRYRRELGRVGVRLSPEVMRLFHAYRWPGNVRELEKAILRALLLAPGEMVGVAHIPAEIAAGSNRCSESPLQGEVEALERRLVGEALERTDWNRSRAARDLGLSLRGLRNKIERYGLSKKNGNGSDR